MDNKALKISKRPADDTKQVTIRVPADLYNEIEGLMEKSNRSRNDIMTLLLRYAIKYVEITEGDKE